MPAIVLEEQSVTEKGTENGNPTFEVLDPSFLSLVFPSVKLDYNAHGKSPFMF